MTTKEELVSRWKEVAVMQSITYSKKRRPNRTNFENLLKIYDLCQANPPAAVAKTIGISRTAVEKQYKRAYRDVHRITVPKAPKGHKRNARRRHSKRVPFEVIEATRGASESQDDVLRSLFVEFGLPLAKLHDLALLTPEERGRLLEALIARGTERRRRGF